MSVASTPSLEFEPLSRDEIINIINEASPFISQDVECEDCEMLDLPDWITIN